MLQEFVRHCGNRRMANATINRTIALLRKSFKPRGLQFPVWQQLQENNVRVGFLEPGEFIRLRKRLPEYLRPLAQFAYESGARKSECLGLEWNQIDFRRREVMLRPEETKNKRGRTIPLTQSLTNELKKLPRTSVTVFTRGGKRIRSFAKAFANACSKAGLSGLRFHDLRRSAVRNLVRAGISERVAMDISGHLTRSVFDRYNVTSSTDLAVARRKLQNAMARWASQPRPSRSGV
jgi:integrase